MDVDALLAKASGGQPPAQSKDGDGDIDALLAKAAGPVGPDPAGGLEDLAFLRPGYKRPPTGSAPAGPPDRIGRAAQGYRENLAGLAAYGDAGQEDQGDKVAPYGLGGMVAGNTGTAPSPHPFGRVRFDKDASLAAGLAQGGTLGFADELEGLGSAVGGTFTGAPGSFADRYRKARDEAREAYGNAQTDNPLTYGAGELAGGVAAPMPGGKLISGAKTVAGKAGMAALVGGATGAAQGLGSSNADLGTDWRRAFVDSAGGGVAGALTGGLLTGATAKIAKDAEKNAAGWVVKDIVGDIRGASTATARQHLATDAESAARLLKRDKELDKAISAARHGGVDELQKVNDIVQDRLTSVGQKMDPHWEAINNQLGGVRSGDLADHLANRVEELRATGLTSDSAEADALEAIRNRVTKARDFGGGKATFNPDAVVQGGDFGGMKAGDAIAKLEPMAKLNPQFNEEIGRIREAATTKGYDPEHIIPAKQIQRLWSDEAGIAYKSHGGINGTPAFEKKLEVASHLRDFRDQMLEQAAQGAPGPVKDLRALNADYSGLKRIQEVTKQRLNQAIQRGTGASVPAHAGNFMHRIIHAGGMTGAGAAALTGHTGLALGIAGMHGAIAGKRMLDKGVANLIQKAAAGGSDAAMARAILAGMERGLPQWAAIQAAREGGPMISEAVPGQTP